MHEHAILYTQIIEMIIDFFHKLYDDHISYEHASDKLKQYT